MFIKKAFGNNDFFSETEMQNMTLQKPIYDKNVKDFNSWLI